MTMNPLTPMQAPQAQAPGQLPNVPAPMQPSAAPVVQAVQPWHQDVVQNFQQAHATLDPLSAGLASGHIGVGAGPAYGMAVIPGQVSDGGGGGAWQGPMGPNANKYGEARGGSEYLQGQPWGQQGNPAGAEDTGGGVTPILGIPDNGSFTGTFGGPTDPNAGMPSRNPLASSPYFQQYQEDSGGGGMFTGGDG